MLKKINMKSLLLLCSCLSVAAGSVTLTWLQNEEQNISHYQLYRSVNNAPYVATRVGFPTNAWTYSDLMPGNNYSFYVTAVNSNYIESAPSTNVVFTPPPMPPAMDILSVRVFGYSAGSWTNVVVMYNTVNLPAYQATNVTITASPAGGGQALTWYTTNNPLTIPALPVMTYSWAASLSNSSGQSPAGLTKVLDGTPPAAVKNLKVQVGP